MKYRTLGKTGINVSEVSLGTWQLGAKWGDPFNEQTALKTLEGAVEQGVNFFDTADVYNEGLSEQTIGKFLKTCRENIVVASKCGRRLVPHIAAGYNEKNISLFVDGSLKRLQTETIDLIQLHCPPTEVYYRPEVFTALDKLKEQGKIRHYGVSVEKIEEALKALEFPGVETVQIIFNIFRQRPVDLFFQQAEKKGIGIIVRVPLASGLLTGKFSRETKFNEHDHRFYNRNGELFDKGETFAGVPYEAGLEAVKKLKEIIGADVPMSQAAIRWILMFPQVSTVIPGASRPEHLISNVQASDLQPLPENQMSQIKDLYDSMIKPYVHQLW